MKISFTVLGEPQGKGRPRFARRGGYTVTYTPKKTASYEEKVKSEYMVQCNGVRFDDNTDLEMSVIAYFKIPSSVNKATKSDMIEWRKFPRKKPDVDNILKIVADGLNGVAYKDDVQIVKASVRKYYSTEPRVEIEICDKL